MNVSAKFPFAFNITKLDTSIYIGSLKNVSFSFVFDYNYNMKIIRFERSQSFSITVFIQFISFKHGDNFCQIIKTLSINKGEAHAIFSFNVPEPISKFREFRGSIEILKILDEKTECALEDWSHVPSSFSSNEWRGAADPNNWSSTVPSNSSSNCAVGEDLIKWTTECIPPSSQLSDDLLRLLNNPDTFPDATMKCGSEEILVHKSILTVRSPVFAAMFKNEMRESNSGLVEIADIEPDVLQATLKYLYSGKTDHLNNDEIAGDLLFAANKYQLEELKKVCVEKLEKCLTVDNVFRVLVLGELHDEGLKTKAKEFVGECGDFSNLEKSEGWKLLQTEYPGLAIEVLLHVVKFGQKCSTKSNASK